MSYDPKDFQDYFRPVKIRCPECDTIQNAHVHYHITPMDWEVEIYHHECEICAHEITENDWEEVSSDAID